jgi:hypothetical protein
VLHDADALTDACVIEPPNDSPEEISREPLASSGLRSTLQLERLLLNTHPEMKSSPIPIVRSMKVIPVT